MGAVTLRTRLALAFFLAALLTGIAVAWLGLNVATRYRDRLEEAHQTAVNELDDSGRGDLEQRTVKAVTGIAELMQEGGHRPVEIARLAGLEILQVLDGAGTVLESLHWPEQVGSRTERFTGQRPGEGFQAPLAGPLAVSPAFLVRVPLEDGDRTLIGGFYRKDRAGALPADFQDHGPWLVPVHRMLVAGLLFALIAALVGILLVRILTRPLDEMTRALDAVAAGDENHDYPQPRGDEFGPMVASFSRMRSNLDREQDRLKAVERVAAWRETARRVAHEVKNPLVPIRLTMENLIKARGMGREQFDPIFEEGARAVLEEVGRLGRIVDAFSAYARMPAPVMQTVDLDRILDPVIALFTGEGNVRIMREPGPSALPVSADPDQLAQAFRNILSNCREAMGEAGGEILIRTTLDGGHAVVEIADSGPGFGDEVLEKLFDPYYTTRKEGTGLGMAITHRIVTEHGGAVTAGNRSGGGARFVVSLPLAGAED